MSLEARLRPRPLSPHLEIYRRTMTMMMSIVHRLTGTALYFGTLLVADRGGGRPKILPTIRIVDRLARRQADSALLHVGADSSSAGRPASFRLGYGQGFDLPTANLMARATLIGSVILTVLVWTIGIWMRGAL